jgi:hypothetical protein
VQHVQGGGGHGKQGGNRGRNSSNKRCLLRDRIFMLPLFQQQALIVDNTHYLSVFVLGETKRNDTDLILLRGTVVEHHAHDVAALVLFDSERNNEIVQLPPRGSVGNALDDVRTAVLVVAVVAWYAELPYVITTPTTFPPSSSSTEKGRLPVVETTPLEVEADTDGTAVTSNRAIRAEASWAQKIMSFVVVAVADVWKHEEASGGDDRRNESWVKPINRMMQIDIEGNTSGCDTVELL